jgi:hypothetical protein
MLPSKIVWIAQLGSLTSLVYSKMVPVPAANRISAYARDEDVERTYIPGNVPSHGSKAMNMLTRMNNLDPMDASTSLDPETHTDKAIFPVPYKSGWTTSANRFENVENVPLSDSALGVSRVERG